MKTLQQILNDTTGKASAIRGANEESETCEE